MSARAGSLAILLAAAVPLAWFAVRQAAIAGAPGFPLDDSWIHLHFARNIAEGAGFSYNPGVPVSGSTAPLWTLLLAAVVAVFGASIVATKLTGIALTAAAGIATWRAALAWGAAPWTALGAGIALLWSGPVAWGALSGMEVSLAALLVAGALWAHARQRVAITAILATLAALARPEALILVPLLALARPGAGRLAAFALVVAAGLAPFVAFSLMTVGAPIPATAAAKIQGGVVGWLAGTREPLWTFAAARPWAFVLEWARWLFATHRLLPLLLLPAFAAGAARQGRALALPALALILHPIAMATLAPFQGPSFQEGRYSIHLLPLALVVLAVAPGPRPGRAGALATAAYLGLALLALGPAADRYAWGVQNINAMQVRLGEWVRANTPAGARIATNDVGAIAFLSRHHVIDLMGLVTPAVIPYRRQGEAGVIRFVAERCPDYVIVFPTWFPALTARRDLLEPVETVRLEHNLVCGGPEMVVYRLVRCGV